MTKGVSVGANVTRDLGSMNLAASETGAAPSSDGTGLIAIILVALAAILIIDVVLYRRRKLKTRCSHRAAQTPFLFLFL